MVDIPTYADVLAARERIAGYVHRTPVHSSSTLNALTQAQVFLKCENLQRVGAFKARGACNAVFALDDEQIKKGVAGTRQLLSYFKKDYSIALMVDQRVSQGPRSDFFKQEAHTTTIPAQFVKKFNCKIVPIYIERINKINFRLTINEPISYSNNQSTEDITVALNHIVEKMIIKNPDQWIWSHNRWK